ncbi:MAG: hypothetical protein R3B72_15175 [Polyangiaceae bacterium]
MRGLSRLLPQAFPVALALSFAVAPVGTASAQAPVGSASEDQKAQASAAYKIGKTAFDEGRLDDALTAFESSYSIVASPNALLMVATTQAAMGRKAEAYETFERVSKEANAAAQDDPKYTRTAETAWSKREELASQVGKLRIEGLATAAEPTDTLVVDGREIPRDRWTQPILVTAGQVEVVLGGRSQRQVEVPGGGEATLSFAATTPGEEDEGGGSSGPPFDRMLGVYVAGGVGAAGLLSFGIFGGLALSKFNSLDEDCPGRVCPVARQGDADSGQTFQTVANVSLVIGLVGVAAAGGLLTWELLDPAPEGDAVTARLSVGPGSIGLAGSF